MASMITTDDIAILFGRALTADEEAEVELLIESAIGEVEAWLGRPVTLTAYTDEQVLPDANGACYFKNTPVVSIEELTINGESITTPDTFITVAPYGIDNLWEQTLEIPAISGNEIDRVGYYGAEVTVSYTAGLDFPAAIKSLIAQGVIRKFRDSVAARARSTAGLVGVKKIQVEDYMTEYEGPQQSSNSNGNSAIAIFQSESDFFSIKRYKRRTLT